MDAGEVIVRREVWRGRPWSALPVTVIEDSDDLLAVHLAVGAAFGFVDDHPLGTHPWSVNNSWQGVDVVMLHRPADAYSVWFFGPYATYINLQDPFRISGLGFDTFDHELDIVVAPDGSWQFKDEERLPLAIESGRFSETEVNAIRVVGEQLGDMLDRRDTWWDPAWAAWTPPVEWARPVLTPAWLEAPTPN